MQTIKMQRGLDMPKNYTGIVEWEHGEKCWYKNGNLHREDGPAVVGKDGEKNGG